MAGAVLVLYLWQRKCLGRLGTTGCVLAFAGSVAAGVNNPIEHCSGVVNERLGLASRWTFGTARSSWSSDIRPRVCP
jgi:hypothetical protein